MHRLMRGGVFASLDKMPVIILMVCCRLFGLTYALYENLLALVLIDPAFAVFVGIMACAQPDHDAGSEEEAAGEGHAASQSLAMNFRPSFVMLKKTRRRSCSFLVR